MKSKRIYSSGFTLIEILVVLAVISILMSVILSGSTVARKKARIYRTRTMIASLETALALYHTDFGAYPPSGNQNLVNLLSDTATYANPSLYPDWNGPYFSFKENDLQGSIPSATLIDPWGFDYYYTLVTVPPPLYKIWSRGPDQQDDGGGDDDIKSW